MNLKNIVANALVILCLGLILLLLGAGVTLRWQECRRIHPWWYCMESR